MAATPVSRQCPSGSYVPIAPKQSTQHTTRAIGRGDGNIPSKLGKIDRIHVLKPIHGSSPRGRGKQVVAMYKQVDVRFIPACAGGKRVGRVMQPVSPCASCAGKWIGGQLGKNRVYCIRTSTDYQGNWFAYGLPAPGTVFRRSMFPTGRKMDALSRRPEREKSGAFQRPK